MKQTKQNKKEQMQLWNKLMTSRGTHWPQINDILCDIIFSTACPVFVQFFSPQSRDRLQQPKTSRVSAVQGLVVLSVGGWWGVGEEKRWWLLAIHVWSKSRYIERVFLVSLYLMEALIRLLPFLWKKSLISRYLPLEIKFQRHIFPLMIDIW